MKQSNRQRRNALAERCHVSPAFCISSCPGAEVNTGRHWIAALRSPRPDTTVQISNQLTSRYTLLMCLSECALSKRFGWQRQESLLQR